MTKSMKLTLSGSMVALGVICSSFYIPIGVAKCFPIQHFINVLAAVLLGPVYGVCIAFSTSLIRVISGTGTLLAFPGSMCGALLSGLLYIHTKKIAMAYLGEVVGTGLIGALIAFPVATLLLSKTVALFAFVIPFGISTIIGSAFSVVLLILLRKSGILANIISLENYRER